MSTVSYNILFNGGISYKVELTHDMLIIYKQEEDDEWNRIHVLFMDNCYLFTSMNDDTYDPEDYPFVENNTLLVYMGNGKYMYIGNRVYTFDTHEKEKIQDYYSPIGNSLVPYPYGVGETYTYLMLEKVMIPNTSYMNRSNKDPYRAYYADNSIGIDYSTHLIDNGMYR